MRVILRRRPKKGKKGDRKTDPTKNKEDEGDEKKDESPTTNPDGTTVDATNKDNDTTNDATAVVVVTTTPAPPPAAPKPRITAPDPSQQQYYDEAYQDYLDEQERLASSQLALYQKAILDYFQQNPWYPDKYEYECVPILPGLDDDDDENDDDDEGNNNNNNSRNNENFNDKEDDHPNKKKDRKKKKNRWNYSSSSSGGSSIGSGSSSSSGSSTTSSSDMDDEGYMDLTKGVKIIQHKRSFRRRFFLFITDPTSAITSAVFYAGLMLLIILMNIMMIIQTVHFFQYTPDDCRFCNPNYETHDSILSASSSLTFDLDNPDDVNGTISSTIPCECPPRPYQWTEDILDWSINIFAVEIIIQVLSFSAPIQSSVLRLHPFFRFVHYFKMLFYYMISFNFVIDFLSIFPYYIASMANSNGLMALRFLQLLRVFLLVRVGQYHKTVSTFEAVMKKALIHIKVLLGILLFGALVFGSLIYWSERGTWQYYEGTGTYEFVRVGYNDLTTISPFTSIPQSFWWFIVTATSVGYGDMFPVTPLGQFIASGAMIMGLLVIAYPVSVFSELWSMELRKVGVVDDTHNDDDDEVYDNYYNTNLKKKISNHLIGDIPDNVSINSHRSNKAKLVKTLSTSFGSGGGGGVSHRDLFAKSKSLPPFVSSHHEFFDASAPSHHSASVRLPPPPIQNAVSRRDLFQLQQQQQNIGHSSRHLQHSVSMNKLDMMTSFRNINNMNPHPSPPPSISSSMSSLRPPSRGELLQMSHSHLPHSHHHSVRQLPTQQQLFQQMYQQQLQKEQEEQQQQQLQLQPTLSSDDGTTTTVSTTNSIPTKNIIKKFIARSNSAPLEVFRNSKHNVLEHIPEKGDVEIGPEDGGTTPNNNNTATMNDHLTLQQATDDLQDHPEIKDPNNNSNNAAADNSNVPNTEIVVHKDKDDSKDEHKKDHHHHHHRHHHSKPRSDSGLHAEEIEPPHHHYHGEQLGRRGDRHHHRTGMSKSGSDSDHHDDDHDDHHSDDDHDDHHEHEFMVHLDSRYIAMKKDHFATLYVQFQIMRESQAAAQRIFRKYKKKFK